MATGKSKSAPDGKVHDVTDQTFEREVIQCHLPVFLVFGAPWCEQSESKPEDPDYDCLPRTVLESVAASHPYVRLAFMDVEKNQEIPAEYEVNGIPCVMLFDPKKDRQPSRVRAGRMSKDELVAFIKESYDK